MDEMGKWAVGKRLAVFCIRESKSGSVWVRAGAAFVNRDGSLNVLLDVLPLDGKLHVREALERKEGTPVAATAMTAPAPGAEAMRSLAPERTPERSASERGGRPESEAMLEPVADRAGQSTFVAEPAAAPAAASATAPATTRERTPPRATERKVLKWAGATP